MERSKEVAAWLEGDTEALTDNVWWDEAFRPIPDLVWSGRTRQQLDVRTLGHLPDLIDVFSCICLGVGRDATGNRRVGFKGKDAVVFGMEALAYTFKLGRHTHVGVQDACKQHVAWRPILIALRMHYHGA